MFVITYIKTRDKLGKIIPHQNLLVNDLSCDVMY
jgi:hypothetical protein